MSIKLNTRKRNNKIKSCGPSKRGVTIRYVCRSTSYDDTVVLIKSNIIKGKTHIVGGSNKYMVAEVEMLLWRYVNINPSTV